MTRSLDRAVGVVLESLDKEKISDNTLVIFINDNGGVRSHDNTPLKGFKGSTWEGGIKVPYVMKWPKRIKADQSYEHPVISLDIFPTVLAAAQVDVNLKNPLDGVNLLPYVTGENQDRPHQTLFWKNGSKWAVRDGDLKLVVGNLPISTRKNRNRRSPANQTSEQRGLYHVADDPSESNNVMTDYPEQVARLTQLYEAWKKDFPKTPWRK